MSENTERLDAIQKRVDADLPLCSPSCPSESCQTAQDRAFLLDLARKQGAVIQQLSQWAGRAKTGYYDEAQDDVVQIIRPALEATP